MPAAEEPAGGTRQVVVWRLGDGLLAVPIGAVVEIAPIGDDGRALTRGGALELRSPPGLPRPGDPQRAVVLRAGDGLAAMAADQVEGVLACEPGELPLPPWLHGIPMEHLAGLVRLRDGRIAALLAPASADGA